MCWSRLIGFSNDWVWFVFFYDCGDGDDGDDVGEEVDGDDDDDDGGGRWWLDDQRWKCNSIKQGL